MKFNKLTIITALVFAMCLLGCKTTKEDEHAGHDHAQHAEAAANAHVEDQGHDDDQDHDESEDVDEHEGEDTHEGEEQAIELTPEEIKGIGLETALATAGIVNVNISLPGEIRVNQDQMAHVVPRVEGVVTEVKKKLGDTVIAGEIIAVIESQSLADAKAGYLAAVERHKMAKLSFDREEKLWKEKISSEQDYLQKKQALTEASIAKRAAEQKLHAIGFDESYLKDLASESDQLLTKFEIKAPFNGTIIKKHIVLGELVGTESAVYIVADLSSVWIDLQVYPKDLSSIKKGLQVVISANSEIPDAKGIISYVGPILGTESRTALARVVLANDSGVFRPGLFITAQVAASKTQAKVVVPTSAIQSLGGKKCVFTKDAHGFEPAFVEIGLANKDQVEILSGLAVGQEYVTKGAFSLKSIIVTSTLDSHAGHGH